MRIWYQIQPDNIVPLSSYAYMVEKDSNLKLEWSLFTNMGEIRKSINTLGLTLKRSGKNKVYCIDLLASIKVVEIFHDNDKQDALWTRPNPRFHQGLALGQE